MTLDRLQSAALVAAMAIAVVSLAIYARDALNPPRAQAAFVFIMVPPVACVVVAILVPAAALLSRRA